MKIKNFKERVTGTALWTGVISLIFLVICFLVVNDFSEGTKYDHQKAYNLVKDTFTFAATLLTPIAAVYFFSDWREQHIVKELEAKSQKIYESIRKINSDIFDLEQEIGDEKNLTKESRSVVDLRMSNLFKDISDLSLLIKNFDLNNSTTKDFVDCSNKIKDELREILFYLEKMFLALYRGNNPAEFNYEYVGETDEQYSNHCEAEFSTFSQHWHESYAKFAKLEKELEQIKQQFRITV